jgi:hypothetical protein
LRSHVIDLHYHFYVLALDEKFTHIEKVESLGQVVLSLAIHVFKDVLAIVDEHGPFLFKALEIESVKEWMLDGCMGTRTLAENKQQQDEGGPCRFPMKRTFLNQDAAVHAGFPLKSGSSSKP